MFCVILTAFVAANPTEAKEKTRIKTMNKIKTRFMMLYPPYRFKNLFCILAACFFINCRCKKGSISAPAESSGGFAFDLS
jgi:hypothetical protein